MTINYTTGYAGTGKSTKLLKLVETLNPETSIIICPTHKAIERLRPGVPLDIELKTIHSLLGWVPGINENAEHINHIDITNKLDRDITEYTTIVIDEAGMMSEDMFTEIISKLEAGNDFETDHITLELFLDPYQLLPVKGKQIMTDPLTTTNLTTQYRSESPDVVSLYTKFVGYLIGTNKTDLKIEESDNVVFKDNIREFKLTDRLLAYTNDCVGNYNTEIAKHFNIKSYEGQPVQLGNKTDLVLCMKFIEPTLDELVNMYNTSKLVLQNSKISKKFLEASLSALIQHKSIDFIEDGLGYVYPVITGIGKANRILTKAKENAVKDKKQFRWVYALGRAFIMDYSFASTVHKAQGSEFDRVWIVKDDIQKSIMNGYYGTYARMMYVAISRAKKKVFVI